MLINGPIARELDINSGDNLLGPGWRANATIGRAVRLIMRNVIGTIPGMLDRSTIGHAGKYTFCFAEDEKGSPWPPFMWSGDFGRSRAPSPSSPLWRPINGTTSSATRAREC